MIAKTLIKDNRSGLEFKKKRKTYDYMHHSVAVVVLYIVTFQYGLRQWFICTLNLTQLGLIGVILNGVKGQKPWLQWELIDLYWNESDTISSMRNNVIPIIVPNNTSGQWINTTLSLCSINKKTIYTWQ